MALPAAVAAAMGRASAGAAAGGATGAATGGAAGAAAGSRAVAGLANVQGAVQQLGQVAHRNTSLIARLGNVVAGSTRHLTNALTLWISWVKEAAAPIENLVRIHNPAVADAFGRAMQDAYGVVGRLLVPVMNAFTTVARKVGDAMAGLEPVFRPAISAIADLVETIGNEMGKTIAEQAPVFELLADVIGKVARAASAAIEVLGDAFRRLGGMSRFIARRLGFDGSTFDRNATSVGAAARQARFVQAKEISDDAIKNALMLSLGRRTPEQHQKKTADTLDNIWTWIQQNAARIFGGNAAGTAGGGGGAAGLGDLSPLVRLMRYAMSRR